MKKTFYITSPIFYPNAQPHLGHAYTTLVCDVLARYHREVLDDDTYFLTGTDEHSEKVVQAARKAGKEPEIYLAEIVDRFKELYRTLDIKYDQFIRTSDQRAHWPGATEMWKRIAHDLYRSEYIGLYCVGCESFKTEKELVDGLCPDHGVPPEKVREENHFFRLSAYASELERLIETDVINIIPRGRKAELLSFIRSGLDDVSFSRPKEKMTWGIPVPGDESQTMYIWVDALTNYLSALGFGRDEDLMRFWPGTHVVGKDILRFHAIIWPAMLLSAGLPLPKQIFVHGMIISGGKKMSKSLGNVIDPNELIEKYGPDATRYLLLRHVHPTEDSDITWERLDEWYTANLVNGLGNVVARILTLSEKYLPEPVKVEVRVRDIFEQLEEGYRFDRFLDMTWSLIQGLDQYITETQPFKVVKEDSRRGKELIVEAVKGLYSVANQLASFMPTTAATIKAAVLANQKPENLFPRLTEK